jgi:hypothetical protein
MGGLIVLIVAILFLFFGLFQCPHQIRCKTALEDRRSTTPPFGRIQILLDSAKGPAKMANRKRILVNGEATCATWLHRPSPRALVCPSDYCSSAFYPYILYLADHCDIAVI